MLTATELAAKYEVSIRTIYRDIRKLEEAGIPVYTIEGRGYSLMDNYTELSDIFKCRDISFFNLMSHS